MMNTSVVSIELTLNQSSYQVDLAYQRANILLVLL